VLEGFRGKKPTRKTDIFSVSLRSFVLDRSLITTTDIEWF
jgi:hypothetical protein